MKINLNCELCLGVLVCIAVSGCSNEQPKLTQAVVVKTPKTTPKSRPTSIPEPASTPTRRQLRRARVEKRKQEGHFRAERLKKEENRRIAKATAEMEKRAAEERMRIASQSDLGIEESSSSGSSASGSSEGGDEGAMADLQSNLWVKDLYVSPGHLNIGVIPGEKDWNDPMIGNYACGVLRKHGSDLNWVRFVDIAAVANQGASPRQAAINTVTCE